MSQDITIIFGCTGYIGAHLLSFYRERGHFTIGTSRKHHPSTFFFDLSKPNLQFLDQLPQGNKTAIICAAIPNIEKCEQNPQETFRLNVLSTLNLVDSLVQRKIKPVVFSSDIVFDGTLPIYTDDSLPSPINEYSSHKTFLERLIPKLCNDYLILRLSKTYSCSVQDQTLLHQLAQRIMQNEKMRAASDLLFNPIHIEDVIEITNLLIENKCRGLYNVTGQETTSWYDLAKRVSQICGKDPSLIEEASIDEFSTGAKRAKNLIVIPKKFSLEFPNYTFSLLEDNINKISSLYNPQPLIK